MALYSYTAKDKSGGRRVGTVDAKSEGLAVELLKNQGLFVVSLEQKRTSFLDSLLEIRGISGTEIVTFTRQFSTMISAGLPISRALEVLADQTTNAKFRKVIMDVLRDVEGGSSLSQAMGRHDSVFSPTYRALVRAGEASGRLDEILQRLAATMEADRELKSRLKSAMIYPAIVLLAMVGVFVLLMVFVIPKLASMYESLDVELPAATQAMISISELFTKHTLIVVLVVAGLFVFMKWFMSTTEGKTLTNSLLFGVPIFGKINREKEITTFARTLSLLISAAIPIVEALNIISQIMQNMEYKNAALAAARSVEKGNSLAEYFRNDKNFPPLFGQMASVGEETGQMDEVLDRVADFFDGETSNSIKGLSSALEPVILVMLGGMVGVLIVSIITPIYKITSAI